MTCLSWVALHGMAHSSFELDKTLVHVIRLVVFCDCSFHSVSPLMEKGKRLMKVSRWERLTEGNVGLILMGGAMLSSIQFGRSVVYDSWQPNRLQASLSITNSRSLFKLMSIESVMPSNHLIL